MLVVLPSAQTVILVSAFATIYLVLVLRKTLSGKFDLHDLFMLSLVAILPATFTLFPHLAENLARISGVAFPFVIMFGALFLAVFIFMHTITARIHKLERQNVALVQELALLNTEFEIARNNQRAVA